MPVNKRESTKLKNLNDSKSFFFNTQVIWIIFIEILKNLVKTRKHKIVVFDDMIADMLINTKGNPIVTELYEEEN